MINHVSNKKKINSTKLIVILINMLIRIYYEKCTFHDDIIHVRNIRKISAYNGGNELDPAPLLVRKVYE